MVLLVSLCARDQVIEEGGLPDAWVAEDHEDRCSSRTGRGDERGEALTLGIASLEHVANLPPRLDDTWRR
jgi:hypothetical protein